MAEKQKKQKYISPRGVAMWPKLSKPDTKFKSEGVYSLKLRITQDEADALYAKHKALLTAHKESDEWKNTVAALTKKHGKGKFKLSEVAFSNPVNTEDGDPTGDATITISAKASGKSKKDGKEWKRGPIALFDAKGQKMTGVEVWGGSEVKVSYGVRPWINAKGEYGLKLDLEGVQVLKLVQGGDRSAGDYGFGEEEGYEHTADESFGDGAEDSAKGDDASSDGDDF